MGGGGDLPPQGSAASTSWPRLLASARSTPAGGSAPRPIPQAVPRGLERVVLASTSRHPLHTPPGPGPARPGGPSEKVKGPPGWSQGTSYSPIFQVSCRNAKLRGTTPFSKTIPPGHPLRGEGVRGKWRMGSSAVRPPASWNQVGEMVNGVRVEGHLQGEFVSVLRTSVGPLAGITRGTDVP